MKMRTTGERSFERKRVYDAMAVGQREKVEKGHYHRRFMDRHFQFSYGLVIDAIQKENRKRPSHSKESSHTEKS